MKSNIPNLMNRSNISVSELSRKTGLSRTTITPLNKNDELPVQTRIDTLLKIASVLNVPISALYSEPMHWDVERIYKVSNGLNGTLKQVAYIIKMTNKPSYGNKPLFVSITIHMMGTNIDLEFMDTTDFNIISYINKKCFDEINVESLNNDSNFLQSINPKFIYAFGNDLFESKEFNTLLNELDKTSETNKHLRTKYFTVMMSPVGRTIVKLGNETRLLATDADDLIRNYNNTNFEYIFKSWAETNQNGKEAQENVYHIKLDNE